MPGWILMGDNFQPGTLTLVIDPDPRRVTPNPKLSKKTFPGVEFLYTSRDFRARLRPIPVQNSDCQGPTVLRGPAWPAPLAPPRAALAPTATAWPEAWVPAPYREPWAAGWDGPASE